MNSLIYTCILSSIPTTEKPLAKINCIREVLTLFEWYNITPEFFFFFSFSLSLSISLFFQPSTFSNLLQILNIDASRGDEEFSLLSYLMVKAENFNIQWSAEIDCIQPLFFYFFISFISFACFISFKFLSIFESTLHSLTLCYISPP